MRTDRHTGRQTDMTKLIVVLMKPGTFPYEEWFETRRCFNVITFQLCFRICLRRVKGHHDGFRPNGTQQLLGCADDVTTLGVSLQTAQENTALIIASKDKQMTT